MKKDDMKLFILFLEEFDKNVLAEFAERAGAYFTFEEITQIDEILDKVYESLCITLEIKGGSKR